MSGRERIARGLMDAPLAEPAAPEAGAARFECPQCGSQLAFAPARQRLACASCGHEEPPLSGPAATQTRPAEDAAAEPAAGGAGAGGAVTLVRACGACGAETAHAEHAQADHCPFCATPFVAPPERRRVEAPSAVLPLLLDATEAEARLTRWLGSRWFAPSGLAAAAAREGGCFTGVYLPFWCFDAEGEADYSGSRGDHYWVTVRAPTMSGGRVRMRSRRVRKTRWRPASGRVWRRFKNVLAAGSTTLTAAEARGLEARGFDLAGLRPYDEAFLAGFRAELYRVPLTRARTAAEARMRVALMAEAKRDIGGDRQRVRRLDDRYGEMRYKLALLPVWIAAYRHEGESYRVVINGRTGAVTGDRPFDFWKIAAAAALAAAAAAAALWAAAAFG